MTQTHHPAPRVASVGRPRLASRGVAVAVLALAILPLGFLSPTADAAAGSLILSSPAAPFEVERLSSLPAQPWLAGHRGIDLAADAGDPVASPGQGIVSFVGFVVNRPVVSIAHAGGLVTSLEPVDAAVAVGESVARGQAVGTVASSPGHCAPATCLHWGLRLDGAYVDPLDYLEGFGPIRLLSLEGD